MAEANESGSEPASEEPQTREEGVAPQQEDAPSQGGVPPEGDVAPQGDGAPDTDAPPESDEALLQAIEESLDDISLEFDFDILKVLDDENAQPSMIEALKDELSPPVSARLFSVANSVYYGKSRSGKITRFVEVVTHLGTDTTKSTAAFVALLGLANTEQIRRVFARSYATSKLVELICEAMEIRGDIKSTASLGGLFVEIGKVIAYLYEEKQSTEIGEGFVDRFYPHLNVKVIEHFELPPALTDVVSGGPLTFIKKGALPVASLVHVAHSIVDQSFEKHNKLVIQSTMPDPQGLLYSKTAGAYLESMFQAMGLGNYLQVVPLEFTDIEQRFLEKHGGG